MLEGRPRARIPPAYDPLAAQFRSGPRQGRLEALLRDLRGVPLLDATTAVAGGRARLNGEPYTWEAEDMVYVRGRGAGPEKDSVEAERARAHFTLAPPAPESEPVDRGGR